MKRILITPLAALVLLLGAQAADAACLVEYKAKRDNPLELFYNVATIEGPCTAESAQAQLQARLAEQGITLLKILSVTPQ